ncbi:hypothetical protein BDY21DRAFT_99163 [Lineolata rhizophorae]|uniref:Uncharacterized protein n=1 Tax=Lineolata rhizophorae TaxID=578093 RepID=A0A6A6NT38_9PEZI|nr:hypothetical protein BDY21DRAFT_99163 [Lineolata rhizophorae]
MSDGHHPRARRLLRAPLRMFRVRPVLESSASATRPSVSARLAGTLAYGCREQVKLSHRRSFWKDPEMSPCIRLAQSDAHPVCWSFQGGSEWAGDPRQGCTCSAVEVNCPLVCGKAVLYTAIALVRQGPAMHLKNTCQKGHGFTRGKGSTYPECPSFRPSC